MRLISEPYWFGRRDLVFTAAAPRELRTLPRVAEVGPDHAGVGPGRGLPSELGGQLNAALHEQRARLLQPPALAAIPGLALRMQQEALDLDICGESWSSGQLSLPELVKGRTSSFLSLGH